MDCWTTALFSVFFKGFSGFVGCFFVLVEFNHRVHEFGRTYVSLSPNPQGGYRYYGESRSSIREEGQGSDEE